MKLQGKVLVVTGGGAGIGRATALELLARGAEVAAVDISEAGLKETADLADAGDRLSLHPLDITDREQVLAQARELRDSIQRVEQLAQARKMAELLKLSPEAALQKVQLQTAEAARRERIVRELVAVALVLGALRELRAATPAAAALGPLDAVAAAFDLGGGLDRRRTRGDRHGAGEKQSVG